MRASQPIPVASPLAAYQRHRAEFNTALQRVLESGCYILGAELEQFEAEFAAYLGTSSAIGVASGTEALWLALRAVGVGADNEVIVPSLTASATVAAIVETGARPVFAEVDEDTLTLDPARLEHFRTERTRAIVPVHLYGNPANLTAITAFARRHDLRIVEDCAQTHGAWHAGQRAGTFGDAAAWSFYPTKNLGAFGDGGMVTTSDPAVAERVRLLREYGWRERYHSAEHGWNSRLDEVQAALLRVRLKYLDEDNARRREIARRYRAALPPAILGPSPGEGDLGAEHLFVVRQPQRAALQEALRKRGIGAAIHYPIPCHLQTAYIGYGRGLNSLPITERACREVLSLPMYPELSDAEVQRVIAALGEALAEILRG